MGAGTYDVFDQPRTHSAVVCCDIIASLKLSPQWSRVTHFTPCPSVVNAKFPSCALRTAMRSFPTRSWWTARNFSFHRPVLLRPSVVYAAIIQVFLLTLQKLNINVLFCLGEINISSSIFTYFFWFDSYQSHISRIFEPLYLCSLSWVVSFCTLPTPYLDHRL